MLTFYVKYRSGATFVQKIKVTNDVWIKYYVRQFRQDQLVERVLVEVQ